MKCERSGQSIPKIIHQSFATSELPEAIRTNIARLQELNPEWEYRFYSDEDIVEYLKTNYTWALDYYLRIDKNYGAARADLFRYLLMYREGGVYLDIKSTAVKPLSQVIRTDDRFILSHWRNRDGEKYQGWGLHRELESEAGEFQQWFIISSPGHPFLKKVIAEVCGNIDAYDPLAYGVGREGTLRLTGPIAYTKAIYTVMDQGEYRFADAEHELGLIYSIYLDWKTGGHHQLFKRHYSKQRGLLIRYNPARNLYLNWGYRLKLILEKFKLIRAA